MTLKDSLKADGTKRRPWGRTRISRVQEPYFYNSGTKCSQWLGITSRNVTRHQCPGTVYAWTMLAASQLLPSSAIFLVWVTGIHPISCLTTERVKSYTLTWGLLLTRYADLFIFHTPAFYWLLMSGTALCRENCCQFQRKFLLGLLEIWLMV